MFAEWQLEGSDKMCNGESVIIITVSASFWNKTQVHLEILRSTCLIK